jgi:hypothetical protein
MDHLLRQDPLSALQHPSLTPVAQGGSFIEQTNSTTVRTCIYDGTGIPYFLWKHGGSPDATLEFLEVNHTTAWNLQKGARVKVPQVNDLSQFPLHPEA